MKYKHKFISVLSLISICILIFVKVVSAQELVNITAIGSIDYEWSVSAEEKQTALDQAKMSAWKKYTSKFNAAKKSQYAKLKEIFIENLDDFIAEVVIQKEKDDKDGNKYSIAIVAKIDPGAVNEIFNSNSEAGQQGAGEASDFGVLFVARVEASRKSFDEKRVTVTEDKNTDVVKEINAENDNESVDAITTESVSVEKSGGSSETKRDKVVYMPSLEHSEEASYAIEEFLVNAGFEPMDYTELDDVPFLDELVDDEKLRKSGKLPARTVKLYKSAAIDAGWTFLGMGVIDIGTPIQDDSKGNIKVSAKVSFKVWMLSDGRAKTVASVRPKVVYAWGDDAGSTEVIAANKAAEYALDTVVSQLQKKGLR